MILLKRLTRYIAKRFLIMILGVFFLCFALIFMIDFVELLRQSGKYGSVPIAELLWMTLLRLPAYSEFTLPFAALSGSIAGFLALSRTSELVIIRAAGMSVWQFIVPGILVAAIIGVISVTLYNPMAANARAESERLRAEAFGREDSLLKSSRSGSWLRQDGVDGASIISASAATDQGMSLTSVTVFQFDKQEKFVERVDAAGAVLRDGFWELRDAWVSRPRAQPESYDVYYVSSYLTPTQVTEALGSVISISFWKLPAVISLAERAGLPAVQYRVQYELLLSRPFLLAVMVILGATVSLRAFRFGGVQTMVVIGLSVGFGFFILAEMSRQMGIAGLASPALAAWMPVLVACLMSLTVLLHQEDG